MKITEKQVSEAYCVASQVYAGKLTAVAGAKLLADEHSLNVTSAGDFIADYKALLAGKVFHRAMSSAAMDYFLNEIELEHGKSALKNAVASLRKHITYYEGHYRVTSHKNRAVLSHHESKFDFAVDFEELNEHFESQVQESIKNSVTRAERLSKSNGIALRVASVAYTFQRNPDVVAEVLVRAAGVCERCHGKAPFKRKSNGTPYLEVHHKKRFADGGADIVKNAIALCPNCHRNLHYGK